MKSYVIAFGVCSFAMACAVSQMPEAPEGQAIFDENCVICHGVTGRGDGEFALGMKPAPADLTKISQRAGGTFPRAKVLSVIDGYAHRAPQAEMPEFGLLLRGESVPIDVGDGVMSPVPRPLAAIMVYLEQIQR